MPGANRFEFRFACLISRMAGVDLLWNPHGAASCRFATRPVVGTRPGHPKTPLPTINERMHPFATTTTLGDWPMVP